MGEWSFIGSLFESLQSHSPLLGRFWLLLMLVFRIVILGTVAGDMFEDEQEEFTCNTAQPGCKQVCYDEAFPISQYRFWVFHIVLIATPSLLFLMYATHHHNKRAAQRGPRRGCPHRLREERRFRRLYLVNVLLRTAAEVGFVVGQWWLYGFAVKDHFRCSRFPCPHTVDCFTSRPSEKTIFLLFYFVVGVVSACASFGELLYSAAKWFVCARPKRDSVEDPCDCQNLLNYHHEEKGKGEAESGKKKKPGMSRSSSSSSSRRSGSSSSSKSGRKSGSPKPPTV